LLDIRYSILTAKELHSLINDCTVTPLTLRVQERMRTNLGATIQSKRAKLSHALRKKLTEKSEES